MDAKNLSQLTTSIKGLSEGEHQFVIRVKNTAGTWSGLYYIPFEIVYKPGDANGDDKVNVGDIMAVINYMAGQTEGIDKKVADVNGDGKVNVGDIMAIINIMAGI